MSEFKRLKEMEMEEKAKLPTAQFMIRKTENRSTGFISYSVTFDLIKSVLSVSKRINQAYFEIVKFNLNQQSKMATNYSEYRGRCRYQLSKGTYESGDSYYCYEFDLGNGLTLTGLLDKDQALQIKICKLVENYGLQIVDRPAGAEMPSVDEFNIEN